MQIMLVSKIRAVARAVMEEEPGAGHVNIIGSVQQSKISGTQKIFE